MDLELTDEQQWLSESVDTLLRRALPSGEVVGRVPAQQGLRVWADLVEFGALTIGGDDGLGAVELCLIARSLGSHLASTPFLGSAAVRLALAGSTAELPAPITQTLLAGTDAIALALLEPGSSWASHDSGTSLRGRGDVLRLHGEKVAIEALEQAKWLAVSATRDGAPALALLPAATSGVLVDPRPAFDPSVPGGAATLVDVAVDRAHIIDGDQAQRAIGRLMTIGSLLAAADAVGAAAAALESARVYASARRQFGRTIGSFQSLRHMLADMHVRQASGWSTVLYAAAAVDDGSADAALTASIAKAYVSRAAREVAHGAMQVFGGIAFTDEHPAHRFLRRIVVRERQFGDAAAHEQALGRAIVQRLVDERALAQAR